MKLQVRWLKMGPTGCVIDCRDHWLEIACNRPFKSGDIPEDLMHGVIVLLHKGKDEAKKVSVRIKEV